MLQIITLWTRETLSDKWVAITCVEPVPTMRGNKRFFLNGRTWCFIILVLTWDLFMNEYEWNIFGYVPVLIYEWL